ncbi:hypothetical protein DAMA08_043710 [Martiniozyma asiatica (nom. inval.)]|nr:hypothetical protein DAMA08_043710 [Martiniozyma asiatica]
MEQPHNEIFSDVLGQAVLEGGYGGSGLNNSNCNDNDRGTVESKKYNANDSQKAFEPCEMRSVPRSLIDETLDETVLPSADEALLESPLNQRQSTLEQLKIINSRTDFDMVSDFHAISNRLYNVAMDGLKDLFTRTETLHGIEETLASLVNAPEILLDRFVGYRIDSINDCDEFKDKTFKEFMNALKFEFIVHRQMFNHKCQGRNMSILRAFRFKDKLNKNLELNIGVPVLVVGMTCLKDSSLVLDDQVETTFRESERETSRENFPRPPIFRNAPLRDNGSALSNEHEQPSLILDTMYRNIFFQFNRQMEQNEYMNDNNLNVMGPRFQTIPLCFSDYSKNRWQLTVMAHIFKRDDSVLNSLNVLLNDMSQFLSIPNHPENESRGYMPVFQSPTFQSMLFESYRYYTPPALIRHINRFHSVRVVKFVTKISHPESNQILIEEKEECPICIEMYISNQTGMILLCGHKFHMGCLSSWFDSSKRSTCPTCRVKIF